MAMLVRGMLVKAVVLDYDVASPEMESVGVRESDKHVCVFGLCCRCFCSVDSVGVRQSGKKGVVWGGQGTSFSVVPECVQQTGKDLVWGGDINRIH